MSVKSISNDCKVIYKTTACYEIHKKIMRQTPLHDASCKTTPRIAILQSIRHIFIISPSDSDNNINPAQKYSEILIPTKENQCFIIFLSFFYFTLQPKQQTKK